MIDCSLHSRTGLVEIDLETGGFGPKGLAKNVLAYIIDRMQTQTSSPLYDYRLTYNIENWIISLSDNDKVMIKDILFPMLFHITFEKYSCGCMTDEEKYGVVYNLLRNVYIEQQQFYDYINGNKYVSRT